MRVCRIPKTFGICLKIMVSPVRIRVPPLKKILQTPIFGAVDDAGLCPWYHTVTTRGPQYRVSRRHLDEWGRRRGKLCIRGPCVNWWSRNKVKRILGVGEDELLGLTRSGLIGYTSATHMHADYAVRQYQQFGTQWEIDERYGP
jgi:hypothetical protein